MDFDADLLIDKYSSRYSSEVASRFMFCFFFSFQIIPMLRAIMIRRSERAYTVLFEYIKTLVPRFRPQSIKCDFEDAQVNAWKAAFPYAKVEGCLWHYDCVCIVITLN